VEKFTEPFYSFMESPDIFGKPFPDLGLVTRLLTGRPRVLRCPAEARGFSFQNLETDVFPSPNIFRVIKLRKMRWVGHVACMGERSGVYRVLVGKH
jgi:hypothetical protein